MKFNTMKMEDALDALIDYRGKTPKKSKTGIMTLSAKSVKNNHIGYSQCYFISEEEYEKFMVRGFPKKGDILLTTEAPLGLVARLDRNDVAIAQRLLTLRGKENVLDNDYLLYYLQSPIGQASLKVRETGTTVTGIKQAEFRKIEIEIPDYEVQKKVSGILRVIDQKIELNNAINNNLEQQAQAMFKSWFVNFEPFDNKRPDNWAISTLGNVSIMGAGGDKPKNVSSIKNVLYQYPIFSNGLRDEGLYGFTDKPKISEESVTVSARGTIGFVCLRHIPYVPIVRLVTLIPETEIISAKYLYLWLRQIHITGTGTTQQQLTVPDFQKTEILVPSQEIMTLFTAMVEPIFEKIWANQNENEKLSSLRDTLLPQLMSGELNVSGTDL